MLQSDKGIFVGMPSKPYTKEFRAALTEAVTAEYHAAVERLQARAAEKPGMQEQMANGAKQAAEHNAKKPPAKGGKDKAAEI